MTRSFTESIESLCTAIIDGIIAFTDHFIVRKRITLSEGALFLIGAARGFWPLLFGYSALTISEILTSPVVTGLFAAITVLHLFSFFIGNLWFRIAAMAMSSTLWCVLGMLVAQSSFASLAVPSFMIFTIAGAFIVIRLIKDQQIIRQET